jgi:hypothetical protein
MSGANQCPLASDFVEATKQQLAETFVKTFKRDYVRINSLPDARTALSRIDHWMEDYNSERAGLPLTRAGVHCITSTSRMSGLTGQLHSAVKR